MIFNFLGLSLLGQSACSKERRTETNSAATIGSHINGQSACSKERRTETETLFHEW